MLILQLLLGLAILCVLLILPRRREDLVRDHPVGMLAIAGTCFCTSAVEILKIVESGQSMSQSHLVLATMTAASLSSDGALIAATFLYLRRRRVS